MLFVLSVIVLLTVIAHHRALARGIPPASRRESRLDHYPPLTAIRPVRGLDVGAAANARALVDSDYPGELEIFFVFDDDDDPGLEPVRSAITGTRARIVFCGAPPPGRTGKLHAMIYAASQARGELIAFSDSDTRLPPDLLRRSIETLLTTPDAANVFVPVVVADEPRRAGDVAYALLQNSWYGPSVARLAGPSGELPFIMG
jgi:ceramide glucosyltransferase